MKTGRAIKAAKAKDLPKGIAPTLAPGYRAGYSAATARAIKAEERANKLEAVVGRLKSQLAQVRKAAKA